MAAAYVKANSNNLPRLDIFILHEFLKRDDRFNLIELKGSKAAHSMREDYGDNAIGYVEVKRDNHICSVRCKVCPEHNVKKANYVVELIINEEEEIVRDVFCNTCPAAAGGCKHALAFLMWIHRRSEEPSPTEVTSYWQQPVLSKIGSSTKFMNVHEFPSGKFHKTVENLNNDEFFNDLMSQAKRKKIDCQLTRYESSNIKYEFLSIHKLIHKFKMDGNTDFDQFLQFAKKHIEKTYTDAEIDTRSQSKSPLWFELRYGRITASKAYEVSRCRTTDGTLVSSIIGAHKIKPTKAMKRGIQLEKRVLKAAEEKLSVNFSECGFHLMCDHPIFGATPDALNNEYVVEVKCPSTNKSFETYIKDGTITQKYKAQINLQMLAAKKNKGLFIVAKPDFETTNEVILLWIMFDETFTNDILTKCNIFYKNNIFNKLMLAA